MFNDILANKYRVMSQAPAPAGETVGTPAATFGKGGLFGNVPTGGTGTYRGFTATNSGPGLPAVISSSGTPFGMMDLLRTQGYTPEQATHAVGIGSAAGLDTVNAGLRPGESAANIALNRANAAQAQAQGGYITAQAGQVAADAQSVRGLRSAQARGANASALSEEQLTDLFHIDPAAYKAVLGLKPLDPLPLRQGAR